MLKIVDAGDQPLPNLCFAKGVSRDFAAPGMRRVDDRLHLFRRQRVGVHDLDPVNAVIDQLAGLRRRIGRTDTFHVCTAFGFPPFVSAGPATYSVGPGISPLAMRFLTARIGCGGAARSRTLVTPAISSCSADAGMMTRSNCGV